MVNSSQFRLLSVQVVAFTPAQGDRFRTSAVLAAIFGRFAERYDGEVESTAASQPIQKMGIAAGGGSEEINLQFIPSFVKFGSSDGHWRFEANAARTDSVWNAKTEEDGQAALAE